ncbi:PAS domain S-box protein [Natronobiforma cellulositropha]|uniref:PAS domain S-box protein n=1 Tax=Natronobiforma cellulositropha TaxID=1679076 RepID=UPI0021D57C5F|nr:PAS domain S-box protein [Natronobiforma cellulositropha]
MATSDHASDGESGPFSARQEALAGVSRRALEDQDVDRVLYEAAATVNDELAADYCGVFECVPAVTADDDGGERALLRQGDGWQPSVVGEASVPGGNDSRVGRAARAETAVVETESSTDGGDLFEGCGVESELSVALSVNGEPWGVLGVYTTDTWSATDADVTFVSSIASVLEAALERDEHEGATVEREERDHWKTTRTLQRLYAITADTAASFEEKVDRVLELGREYFGVSIGFLAAVDEGEGRFEVRRARSENPQIQPGVVTPLEETYCRETLECGEQLAFHVADDAIGEAAYERYGLDTYLGGPVVVDGVLYGTLCFCDESPRGKAFSPSERTVAELLTQWIGDELGRRERAQELSRYETIVETVEDGIYVLDEEGRFETVNRAYADLVGYERDELLGAPCANAVGEDVAREAAARIDEIVAGETTVATLEAEIGPGGEVDAESKFTALEGSDGEFAGSVGVVRDVTERNRMSEELRKSDARFHQFGAHTDDVLWVCSPDGDEIHYVNAAYEEIWGRSCASLYAEPRSFLEAVHEDDRAHITAAYDGLDDGSTDGYDEEYRVVRPDGSVRWVRDRAYPITDDGGAVSRLVGIAEDVTERKHLHGELEATFERITDAFYALDTDWTFTYANERAASLIDPRGEGVVGENLWEAFPAAESSLGEEYRRAMETQEAASFEMYYPEPLSTWFEVNVYPSETGLSVYFRDVTERKEMEHDLRQSEATFRMVSEHLHEVVWMSAADPTNVLYINPTYEEVWGRRCASLYDDGLAFLEGIHPDDRERVREAYTALPDEEYDQEFRVVRPDGTLRWVHARAAPVENEDGEVFRLVGIAKDVTERKVREQKLAKYETIVETTTDGIYSVDAEGRFTMVNEAYARLTGYTRGALLGAHASLVVDDEARERARTIADTGGDTVVETEIETAAGAQVPVEGTVSAVPGRDHGEYRRIGIVRDVSDRMAQQRALEESERRYRTLVEHFPNGAVGLFDDELRYTVVGGKLLAELEIEPADVVGTTADEHFSEDVAAAIEPEFRAALAGESNTLEFEFRERYLRVHTLPVEDASGEVFAGMLLVQDVTEREENVRKLEASNERLEQFAYAASHDLQEPLRMVSSYLTLIDHRYGDRFDDDGREFLAFAVDGADRMREMIDGLLTYSRIETHGDPFDTVDLHEVFDDALEDLQVNVAERDATVTADVLPTVTGDARQLRQLFQNLLHNGIKYVENGSPRIHVSAEESGHVWELSVSDNGIGIDATDAERVFDVFHRLHSTEAYPGAGIGLALCQRIVERHGGEIWVDSTPGDGSTFRFTLPTAHDTPQNQ